MRSSLDLVSFGRIHHFYLRHNADSERTSSRLRGQCRSFHLQKESLETNQRFSAVTLGVKDLGSSKKFYVDGFGWKPVYEDNDIIFLQTGGMVFALFRRDHLAADFQADPAASGPAPMALAYNVRARNEVNPLIQRAVAAGATILKPPRDTPWGGYSGYFGDPMGLHDPSSIGLSGADLPLIKSPVSVADKRCVTEGNLRWAVPTSESNNAW